MKTTGPTSGSDHAQRRREGLSGATIVLSVPDIAHRSAKAELRRQQARPQETLSSEPAPSRATTAAHADLGLQPAATQAFLQSQFQPVAEPAAEPPAGIRLEQVLASHLDDQPSYLKKSATERVPVEAARATPQGVAAVAAESSSQPATPHYAAETHPVAGDSGQSEHTETDAAQQALEPAAVAASAGSTRLAERLGLGHAAAMMDQFVQAVLQPKTLLAGVLAIGCLLVAMIMLSDERKVATQDEAPAAVEVTAPALAGTEDAAPWRASAPASPEQELDEAPPFDPTQFAGNQSAAPPLPPVPAAAGSSIPEPPFGAAPQTANRAPQLPAAAEVSRPTETIGEPVQSGLAEGVVLDQANPQWRYTPLHASGTQTVATPVVPPASGSEFPAVDDPWGTSSATAGSQMPPGYAPPAVEQAWPAERYANQVPPAHTRERINVAQRPEQQPTATPGARLSGTIETPRSGQ